MITRNGKNLREVDPLEPQPGDKVTIYTPYGIVTDSAINWEEGVVEENCSEYIKYTTGEYFSHDADVDCRSVYFIVEENI